MGAVYWIGVALGLGAGAGVLLAGMLATSRVGIAGAVLCAAAVGAGIGLLVWDVEEAVAGALGGVAGAAGTATVVRGALRRGGLRGATAALIAVAGLACAALAFIPFVGYLEALVLPALGVRVRRREGDRYAGLRILARD